MRNIAVYFYCVCFL